jgi:integrase/recombinase XerD
MQAAELPPLLERFFSQRLIAQRRASPHTVASYRDTFRLLLVFAENRLSRAPAKLTLADLNAPFLSDFLEHLEASRSNKARSRNLRLTALRSFFRYAALEAPQHAQLIQRVLSMPNKRHTRPLIGFLTRPEIDAILAAVDRTTWIGRRDHALLLIAMQTGLRLSEMTGLHHRDVVLGPGAHVHCLGKGRKERGTPLTKSANRVLDAWVKEAGRDEAKFLFPSLSGGKLSHDAVQDLVRKHVAVATKRCPSLGQKRVTPHVLRHTAAMELMQAGVDRSMIALWLGHESVETTQIYLDANLAIKEEILAKATPINGKAGRYRPGDRLLGFLRSL